MQHKPLLAALLLTAIGCGSAIPQVDSTADLQVTSLSPAQRSTLDGNSVLTADIRYTIHNFRTDADYYIAPQFGARQSGSTFSVENPMKTLPRLEAATGQVSIRHPVAPELQSDRLARPIQVWFYAMQRTGEKSSVVIGRAGPFEYR